ncbi:stalk domain-containing protein [Paenibacillus chartarius]|uniref:Stalk domain-containing protein n=1 Tax=Paenibacillus chartarius TaxID=747481 RepID=A0ABV6DJT4_9BACL
MKPFNKLLQTVLVTTITITGVSTSYGIILPASTAYAADPQATTTMNIVSQEPITAGAILKKYRWQSIRSKKPVSVQVNVIEVDVTNPNVKLDVMTGTGGQFAKRNTTSGMVKETGAVAGINGDFYNTQAEGAPDGPQIAGGKLMATPPIGLAGLYSFALDKNNRPIIDSFSFRGSVTAKDGSTFPLGGVNKTSYWYDDNNGVDGQYGLLDGMFVYTSDFATESRTNDGQVVPSEILVKDGIIQQIAIDSVIPGLVPQGAIILKTNGKATEYVKQHLKVGDPLKVDYAIVHEDASRGYDPSTFKMMIGGQTLLVLDGKPSIFTRDLNGFSGYSAVSRTAIGYSQDSKTVYLITADLNGDSDGMTIPELQDAMVRAGVWKGMVLDGGGSTTMVSRPLGETSAQLTAKLQNGVERRVVNGVGVYSTAPKSTVVKGLLARGATMLFIGEKSAYQFKAYDEYYNPMDAGAITTQWSSSQPIGTFAGNEFTATKPGTTQLSVSSGQGQASLDVQVIGRNDIAGMSIRGSNLILSENETFRLPVTVTTKSGQKREVPSELINWELKGFKGEVKDGALTVTSLSGSTLAQIIARYDGYSTMLALPVGQERMWYNLDGKATMTTSDKAPAETTARVQIVQAPETTGANNALEIAYDFSKGTGTKAAYALFNQTEGGAKIDGTPEYMKLKVYGDNSLNWLRALITDANGKEYRLDLANPINWSGWKTVSLDLSEASGLKYPITLKSIYVANPEQNQDERASTGKIALDDIAFVYPGQMPAATNNQVKLTINNRKGSINGKAVTLEQAPIIINGNTMIPVRFAAEALGANVEWEPNERKVTITRGTKLIDLWIDSPDLLVNGGRVTAEVAPVIRNNLTLVPLRIIAENMGWKVEWDPKSQNVNLQ